MIVGVNDQDTVQRQIAAALGVTIPGGGMVIGVNDRTTVQRAIATALGITFSPGGQRIGDNDWETLQRKINVAFGIDPTVGIVMGVNDTESQQRTVLAGL